MVASTLAVPLVGMGADVLEKTMLSLVPGVPLLGFQLAAALSDVLAVPVQVYVAPHAPLLHRQIAISRSVFFISMHRVGSNVIAAIFVLVNMPGSNPGSRALSIVGDTPRSHDSSSRGEVDSAG